MNNAERYPGDGGIAKGGETQFSPFCIAPAQDLSEQAE